MLSGESLDILKFLEVTKRWGGKEYSIREVGGHLYMKYKNHKASHVLTCCPTKNKKKVLKIKMSQK